MNEIWIESPNTQLYILSNQFSCDVAETDVELRWGGARDWGEVGGKWKWKWQQAPVVWWAHFKQVEATEWMNEWVFEKLQTLSLSLSLALCVCCCCCAGQQQSKSIVWHTRLELENSSDMRKYRRYSNSWTSKLKVRA